VSIKIIDLPDDGQDKPLVISRDQLAELGQHFALQMDGWMTSDQVCDWLQLRKDYLYDLVAHDRIPHVKLGPRILRFKRTELDAWIESHR
jgi:excisionase family DNA binding protein